MYKHQHASKELYQSVAITFNRTIKDEKSICEMYMH